MSDIGDIRYSTTEFCGAKVDLFEGTAMIATYVLLGLAALLLVVGCATFAARIYRRKQNLSKARETFHLRREWLEADFLSAASTSGKPRGLSWVNCDFEDAVTFARDRTNHQLRAFVAVTISFEAIEGGGMEHVEAVGNLRSATAVFHYAENTWSTDGRAIFNLGPVEAVNHFGHELELA